MSEISCKDVQCITDDEGLLVDWLTNAIEMSFIILLIRIGFLFRHDIRSERYFLEISPLHSHGRDFGRQLHVFLESLLN
jgi:hypothetical protein